MKSKVTISGIVLTHNNINTIKSCIESFKKFDDIIVLDSDSTDGTFEYLEGHEKVTLFTGPQIGGKWISVHNSLIRECKTSHCFYLDSDEMINIDVYDELKALWKKESDVFPITARVTIIHGSQCKKERHPDPQFRAGPVDKLRYYNPKNEVHERLDPKYTGVNPKVSSMKHIIVHNRDINQEWCRNQLERTQGIIRKSPGARSLYDEYKVSTFEDLAKHIKNMESFSIYKIEEKEFVLPRKKRLGEFIIEEA